MNLFGNFSKFVRGVSKLVSFFQIQSNYNIIIIINIMGRGKQTSSQEYAAMLCWVEVPISLDHIVGAATKNLKSVVAGAKVTKTSVYGELAKHVNDESYRE